MCGQCGQIVRQSKPKTNATNQRKASGVLVCRVREHDKTSQTIKTRKKIKQEKKNNRNSEQCDARSVRLQQEQQKTTARTKQHEEQEEDSGVRPAGREDKETKKQG